MPIFSDWLFNGSGDRNILHFISDGRKGGLNNEKLRRLRHLAFCIPILFKSELSMLLEMQKASQIDWLFFVAGTGLEPVTFGL